MKKSLIYHLSELPQTLFQQIQNQDTRFFPDPWSDDSWQTSLDQSDYLVICILDQEQLVAWSLFKVNALEGLLHLLKILVLPERRKQGLAENLMNEASHWAHQKTIGRCYLEVDKANLVAINFYQKLGFKILHEIKRFYSDGRNALTMELKY